MPASSWRSEEEAADITGTGWSAPAHDLAEQACGRSGSKIDARIPPMEHPLFPALSDAAQISPGLTTT